MSLVAGVLATEAASSMFPYCCPSSSRKGQHCPSSQQRLFFFAHAVYARGSEGHQNVLSLIGYSHILEKGESKSQVSSKIKQNKPNQKPKHQRKTPGEPGETLRFLGLVRTRLQRDERLFTNRSNRLGDDMKDDLRTDGDPIAWRIWSTAQNQLWQLRQLHP